MEQLGAEARDWVELRRGDPLTWQDLQRLATPGSALVSLAEVNVGLVAFVLRHGADEPVVVQTELCEQELTDTVRRMRRQVASADRSRRESWDRPLVPLLEEVARHLDGVQQVVLAPQAFTYLIPWVVVAHRAGWRAPDGGPMPLVTVPALGMLPPLRRRAPGTARRMVVVGDPCGDLPFARSEACAVASQLGACSLIGPQATSEAVLSELARADVVHLATHAHFDQRSPLDSGLVLADRILTTREVLASPMRAELIVLSACETGLANSLGGNELAGLGQAVLYAGARAVVMSLWRVDDAATSALMGAFYSQLTAGADAAAALSRGAAEVRVRSPHPAFWGAFVFAGDAPAGRFRELGRV